MTNSRYTFLDFTWTGTIGSLQSWFPAPVRPLDTSMLTQTSLSACSESLSLWSMVGCFRLHFEQEILLRQCLLMCPVHKQPKQMPFSFKNSIFFSCAICPNCAHVASVCPAPQKMHVLIPGVSLSLSGFAV